MSAEVYRERAQLVAFVASLYPSVIAYSDPSEPEWPVIYVDGPAGQMSWHLSKGDLGLFPHVPVVEPLDIRAVWDGHTTQQKYERLAAIPVQVSGGSAGSTSRHNDPHFGPTGWCRCLCPACQRTRCVCPDCRDCGDR